jgi:hypothetical protein
MANLENRLDILPLKTCGNPPILLGEWQEWQGGNKRAESTPKTSIAPESCGNRPKARARKCLTSPLPQKDER